MWVEETFKKTKKLNQKAYGEIGDYFVLKGHDKCYYKLTEYVSSNNAVSCKGSCQKHPEGRRWGGWTKSPPPLYFCAQNRI